MYTLFFYLIVYAYIHVLLRTFCVQLEIEKIPIAFNRQKGIRFHQVIQVVLYNKY